MRRLACGIVGLALCLSQTAPATAASRWTRLRTTNFVLIGEGGERPLRRVAERLEQFREVFARVFPSTRQAMPAPIVVYVFPSEKAYQPFMPLFGEKRVDVGGYFVATPGAYYVTMNAEAGSRAYSTIFHEYVHLLTANALDDVPVWFSEGLAEYYETFELHGEREAILGRVNEDHVLNLRQRFIPLGELLAVDHRSSLYNEGNRRSIFYAESWALVHYLLLGSPQRQGQLAAYLRKYAGGMPSAAAIREAFGSEAELEKELRRYVQQSVYQSNRYRFQDKVVVERDWVVDQPTDADGQAALADLQLVMRRPEDAVARAEAALTLVPEHARALAVLGRVRTAQGREADAAALFDRAAAAAGDDYLPPYYHAVALLRADGGASAAVAPEAARQALPLLQRVTALQPRLADAHALSAVASLVLDDPAAAVVASGTAFSLSPRHEYALLEAQARVELLDRDRARPLLTALATRGSSEWVRNEALRLLNHLSQIEQAASRPAAAAGPSAEAVPPGGSAPADAASSPGAPPRMRPLFRALAAGEIRELGVFEGVDCAPGSLVFRVRTPDRLLRVSATAFDQVEFLTYRPEAPGQVSCGGRASRERVFATYTSGGGARGSDGVLLAIELLPDDYQP